MQLKFKQCLPKENNCDVLKIYKIFHYDIHYSFHTIFDKNNFRFVPIFNL